MTDNIIQISELPEKTTLLDTDWLITQGIDEITYKISKANAFAGMASDDGQSNASDPLFSSVILLLKAVGTNGSNGIIDSSSLNRNIANYGVIVNTAIKKYEQASLYFNDGSLLDVAINDFNWSGNFTIDYWFLTPDISNIGTIIDNRPDATNGNYLTLSQDQGRLSYYQNGAEQILTGQIINNNQWHYIGVKRENQIISLWVDGNQRGSYNNSSFTQSNRLLIGGNAYRQFAPSTFSYCYISGLRITNSARDLSIVPTTAFSNQ